MTLPPYSDTRFWEEMTDKYILDKSKFVGLPTFESNLWEYFKLKLSTGNRYFFKHKLLSLIKEEIKNHIQPLRHGKIIFRARIDKKGTLYEEFFKYENVYESYEIISKNLKTANCDARFKNIKKDIDIYVNSNEFQNIKKRIESGFYGFDAKESGAPPSDIVTAGRCNPEHVSYLYSSSNINTSLAEVRPFFNDTVSVAKIKVNKNLVLINLDYDPNDIITGENYFFNEIQEEFSKINKAPNGNYFITQYLTSFIKECGYDGLAFKSSLVNDGTNYVIFNPENCTAISSNLYLLSDIKYRHANIAGNKKKQS